MVSREIKINKLVSFNFNVDWHKEDNVTRIIFYVGADGGEYQGKLGDKEYHLQPDQSTINRLKVLRNKIITQLQETIIIEGTIIETHEVKEVTYPEEVKVELVKV